MSSQRIRLWDLPIRIFHWSLAVLVGAAIITGKMGGNAITWHGRIGLCILGLIVFRIVWGVAGSTYARFAHFLPTPRAALSYLRGHWQGVGHNPIGALFVLALLALLALQVATGLPGNDDIAFRGPLFDLIGKDLSDRLTGLHKFSVNLLLVLVAAHVAAIVFYIRVRKDNLLEPMLTGWKEVPAGTGKSAQGGGPRAFFVALLLALAAVYGGSGEWISAPPAAPPAATANW